MAKIDLNTVSSGYLSQAALNANFTAIEDEFQNKVLYRDNPSGEPNSMQTHLDMNGYHVLNAGNPSLMDASNIAYTPNGTGAETRTIAEKLNDVVSVKDFGAVGDGVTDDTAAIQAAINACYSAGGGYVTFPSGTFLTSNTTLKAGVQLEGKGAYATTIKLKNSANADIITVENAYSLFGTTATGTNGWGIHNLTLDGNDTNQSPASPDTCNGIACYSAKYVIRNVIIKNVKGHGIRSEWQQYGEITGGMESSIENTTVDTVGRHGWWAKGPHDHHAIHFVVVDASKEANNTYSGIYTEGYMNGRFFNCHVWHRSAATNRCAYAVSSGGGNQFVACHFEGCRSQLQHRGQYDVVSSSLFYAHFGSAGTAMVCVANNDNLHSNCLYQNSTSADCYAIEFLSSAAGNAIASARFLGFSQRTPFLFTSDGGLNVIDGNGYATPGGATSFGGTKSATTRVSYRQSGTAISVNDIGSLTETISIGGSSGAEGLKVISAANVVNRLEAYGQQTGNSPRLYAQGSDTNVGLQLSSKGTGSVDICTNLFAQLQARFNHIASAVNYLSFNGAATGSLPQVVATGSDTNISLALKPKGTGIVFVNGPIAFQAPASATPSDNEYMTFQLTSNTQLTIKVKGTDGTVRSANLTLA